MGTLSLYIYVSSTDLCCQQHKNVISDTTITELLTELHQKTTENHNHN